MLQPAGMKMTKTVTTITGASSAHTPLSPTVSLTLPPAKPASTVGVVVVTAALHGISSESASWSTTTLRRRRMAPNIVVTPRVLPLCRFVLEEGVLYCYDAEADEDGERPLRGKISLDGATLKPKLEVHFRVFCSKTN
jgi:hypothetical protein